MYDINISYKMYDIQHVRVDRTTTRQKIFSDGVNVTSVSYITLHGRELYCLELKLVPLCVLINTHINCIKIHKTNFSVLGS